MSERILPGHVDLLPQPVYRTILFDKKPTTWESIKHTIFRLHREAFTDVEDLEEKLQKTFMDPKSIAPLLCEGSMLVGCVTASPMLYYDPIRRRHIKTAYGGTIVIDPAHRGRKNVGLLSKALGEELIKQGYEQIEVSVVTENGFAETVERYFGAQGRLLPHPDAEVQDALRKDRKHFLISLTQPSAEPLKAS